MKQKANEHVFGGGRMLMGRSVSSQRLAREWILFLLVYGEETRGFFLDQCTLVDVSSVELLRGTAHGV